MWYLKKLSIHLSLPLEFQICEFEKCYFNSHIYLLSIEGSDSYLMETLQV